jgi:uncharacterized repeat protein (TIGR03803 family)
MVVKSQASHCLVALALFYTSGLCLPAAAQIYQEIYGFGGGMDGGTPDGALVEGKDGNFYGTTFYGGPWDQGTIFKIGPEGSLTRIASFDATFRGHPVYALLQANDGNFYGTNWRGDVFKVKPDGTLTYVGGPGTPLAGELIQGTNGYIYGVVAVNDWAYGWIFRSSLDWQSGQVLHEFTWDRYKQDGVDPGGGLIQARDGNFYGTTSGGGAYGNGTVFRMTPEGQLTTIVSFDNIGFARNPGGRLQEGSDGNFYGIAEGGVGGNGTLFRVTPAGILTTLHSFNCFDGQEPNGGLIEANDGNFYGTAPYCGANSGTYYNVGTAFRAAPSGAVTPLFAFTGVGGAYPGANPYAGLIQGSDGNLYGTTGNQGSHGIGNVFRIIMPGPLLTATRSHRHLVLSWRTNYTGFTLQSSTNLASANWTTCSNSPVVSGGQFVVTNLISSSRQFFRLKK